MYCEHQLDLSEAQLSESKPPLLKLLISSYLIDGKKGELIVVNKTLGKSENEEGDIVNAQFHSRSVVEPVILREIRDN